MVLTCFCDFIYGLALFFKKLIVSLYADAPSVVCMPQSELGCSNIVPFNHVSCLSRREYNLLCSFMMSCLKVPSRSDYEHNMNYACSCSN